MKQKVLYILTKSDVGGAQKYVSDLMKNIDKNLFETEVLYGEKNIFWLSNATHPWSLFLNDWLAIAELIKIYRKKQPDIIHLNSSKAGVLGSIAAKIYKAISHKPLVTSPKVIFAAHGWVFNPTNALSLPTRWFYIILHKIAANCQDKIICVSEYDYDLALRYHIAPKDKLTAIHNGINPNIKFLDKETARKELKNKIPNSKFQIPNSNYPWVGSIGRLVKEKNYETLLRAAALTPETYFFIIGEGPELNMLKVKSEKLKVSDRFFFIDPTGEDAHYLKAFDIFVMSSIKEGLPYILLEAMAASLPIVVTEAGGMPEVIKNHENGLMVSQKNPALLAKTISGLLANKKIAAEMAIAAKNQVIKKFGLTTMAKKTEDVYNGILTEII